MDGPVYALNLFNVADRDQYLAYSRALIIAAVMAASVIMLFV
jgi:hypothetical protein